MSSRYSNPSSEEGIRDFLQNEGMIVFDRLSPPVPDISRSSHTHGVYEAAERIRDYIQDTYIIIDGFSSHEERRVYRKDLFARNEEVARWLDQHSKLRANRVTSALLSFGDLELKLKSSNPELLKLATNSIGMTEEDIEEFYSEAYEYSNMSFKDKLAFVQTVDEIGSAYLTALTKDDEEEIELSLAGGLEIITFEELKPFLKV